MIKNWKTTVAGLITSSLILILSAIQAGGVTVKDLAIAVGLQVIASLAKDFNVSGK